MLEKVREGRRLAVCLGQRTAEAAQLEEPQVTGGCGYVHDAGPEYRIRAGQSASTLLSVGHISRDECAILQCGECNSVVSWCAAIKECATAECWHQAVSSQDEGLPSLDP